MSVRVLALDLERTLIDNSLNCQPRPGLTEFLEFCNDRFERVMLFTTVEETDVRQVADSLVERGFMPEQLLWRLEFVSWHGQYKDLSFVPDASPEEVLLVDDDEGWIHPDQRDRWIAIAPWDGGAWDGGAWDGGARDGEPDTELDRVRSILIDRLRETT